MNSVLISVHIHVDRNMGSLVDVLWTELWKRQGVDTQGSAGRPGALSIPGASHFPTMAFCDTFRAPLASLFQFFFLISIFFLTRPLPL